MCKQLVIVKADTPEEFQEAFNSKLRELDEFDPTYEFHHGAGYCAYIIYSDNEEIIGRIKKKTRYLCDSCMKCVEPPAPRVKWRKCALYGGVHGRMECEHYLEVFS